MGIKASWAPSLSFHLNKVQPYTIHNVNTSLILVNRPIKSSDAQPLCRHHPCIQIQTTTTSRRAEGLMDVYYLSLSDWIWITMYKVTLPSQNTRIITATNKNNAQSVSPSAGGAMELLSSTIHHRRNRIKHWLCFEIQIHRITDNRREGAHFLNLQSSKLISRPPKNSKIKDKGRYVRLLLSIFQSFI